MKVDIHTRDEFNDLANTVDIASDHYKVVVTQLFLRNYQSVILEEHDGKLISARKILDALQRHTSLGYFGALGEEVPTVKEKHVLFALEKMQVPEMQTGKGLFWDLGALNATAHDKAALRFFLGTQGNSHVRTFG